MGRLSGNTHILVVDDDPISLELLADILEGSGYTVTLATNGREALLLATSKPDLVLLDYHLPDMDGLQVCSQLKAMPETMQTPVIILTSSTDPSLEAKGLEIGAADFVTKPVSAAVLRARVRTNVLVKQQQTLLARSEKQARAFLNTATDAVIVIDAESRILEFNEAGTRMFGYSAKELAGKSLNLLMPANLAERHLQHVHSLVSLNESRRMNNAMEVMGLTKDGRQFPVEVSIGRAGHDDEVMFVGIVRDITERRKYQEEMAAARQRELDISAMIQKQLLFGAPPSELQGFEIALFNRPSQGVDGDFHTFTRLGPQCFEILTGDVMGKGVAAALLGAGVTNSYRRAVAELMYRQAPGQRPGPAEIVNSIHALVGSRLIEFNAFVTMTLLRVDAEHGRLSWVHAGHTPILLASNNKPDIQRLTSDNLPLGVLENEIYEEHHMDLHGGDTLLLYSDGISEAVDCHRVMFGDARIEQMFGQNCVDHLSPSAILEGLRQQLQTHMHGAAPTDDMTAIVIRRSAETA